MSTDKIKLMNLLDKAKTQLTQNGVVAPNEPEKKTDTTQDKTGKPNQK